MQAETMVIMRNGGPSSNTLNQPAPSLPEEDPYGRCTNMRLPSFSESSGAGPRDPRIIDLAQSTALSNGHSNGGQGGGGGLYLPTSNGGSHTMPTMGQASNCHTLPAQGLAGTNPYQGGFNFLMKIFVNIEIVARPPVFPPAQPPASQGRRVPATSSRRWWSPSPRSSWA